MLRRAITAVVSIIYVAFLLLCCYSGPVDETGAAAPVIGTERVSFQAGSFPVDAAELTLVLQSGETALLDKFPQLQSADFSGSLCYEELASWAKAHPEVAVRYTVTLPDGSVADTSTETLDLSGLDSAGALETAKLLPCLPALKSVNLGTAPEGGALSGEALLALKEACPAVHFAYAFTLLGRTVNLEDESVDLTGLTSGQTADAAAALACMPNLKSVSLGAQDSCAFTWEDIGALQAACPEAAFDYSFTLWGRAVNLKDESLDLNHITMDDEGAAVRAVLPYMTKCKTLDMDFCNVSNGAMEGIRNDFPNIKVIWRIWFGTSYSVRTDVEKILASKPSKGGTLDDEQVAVLKYCTDVKYLDLGHNEAITDLSFISSMPKLEVLIIAMNPFSDISPLANCPKLEYLELHTTNVSDLSPLSGLSELRHLNIGNCKNLTDISPLYGLTELERLWIGSITPIPAEQVEYMRGCAPDCEINTDAYDPCGGRWRVIGYTELSLQLYEETGWLQEVLHPRYELLREQFGYLTEDYSFYWKDPLYNGPSA